MAPEGKGACYSCGIDHIQTDIVHLTDLEIYGISDGRGGSQNIIFHIFIQSGILDHINNDRDYEQKYCGNSEKTVKQDCLQTFLAVFSEHILSSISVRICQFPHLRRQFPDACKV